VITLEQPSMALNDSNHSHLVVQMWNTWFVQNSDTAEKIIGWVAKVARGAAGGKLKHVVFACHGSPGRLEMGGQGFDRSNTALFGRWAGLVERIWLRACRVAYIQYPGAPVSGDGNLFCSEIAKAAKCYVVASTETQWALGTTARPHTLEYGRLDTFEGLLLVYGPGGDVTWSHRYSSDWESNRE
jgi:hypothetical protein